MCLLFRLLDGLIQKLCDLNLQLRQIALDDAPNRIRNDYGVAMHDHITKVDDPS